MESKENKFQKLYLSWKEKILHNGSFFLLGEFREILRYEKISTIFGQESFKRLTTEYFEERFLKPAKDIFIWVSFLLILNLVLFLSLTIISNYNFYLKIFYLFYFLFILHYSGLIDLSLLEFFFWGILLSILFWWQWSWECLFWVGCFFQCNLCIYRIYKSIYNNILARYKLEKILVSRLAEQKPYFWIGWYNNMASIGMNTHDSRNKLLSARLEYEGCKEIKDNGDRARTIELFAKLQENARSLSHEMKVKNHIKDSLKTAVINYCREETKKCSNKIIQFISNDEIQINSIDKKILYYQLVKYLLWLPINPNKEVVITLNHQEEKEEMIIDIEYTKWIDFEERNNKELLDEIKNIVSFLSSSEFFDEEESIYIDTDKALNRTQLFIKIIKDKEGE